MSDMIAVEFKSGEPQHLQGPVAVLATLTNIASTPVSVLLPYPNPNNLAFRSLAEGFAEAKAVDRDEIERTAPVTIPAGGHYQVTYFLNRYFRFREAGNGAFEYQLQTLLTGSPGSKHETFRGTFSIKLKSGSNRDLLAALDVYSSRLESSNRQTKSEAAEALAYLDTPLVEPYLEKMLRIDNLQVIGIHALGRHPGPQSEKAIRPMLGNPDSAVVGAALDELTSHGHDLARRDVQKLLTSDNPNTQWLALHWLTARPSPEDLPLITPLLTSPNAPVRDQAKAYSQTLQR